MRYSWICALLIGALALGACNGGSTGAGTGAEVTVPETTDTPTPELAPSTELTDTTGTTGTEAMTETTGTEVMTETETMTDTGATGTEVMTETEAMTDTGAVTTGMGTGVMIGENAEYGSILTDSEGRTVYMFAQDTSDASSCTGDCANAWPPVPASEQEAIAGDGLDQSLLGAIERDDGARQLTYNGHPLYYYAEDVAPGDANGQGVGGNWYVLDDTGNPVES